MCPVHPRIYWRMHLHYLAMLTLGWIPGDKGISPSYILRLVNAHWRNEFQCIRNDIQIGFMQRLRVYMTIVQQATSFLAHPLQSAFPGRPTLRTAKVEENENEDMAQSLVASPPSISKEKDPPPRSPKPTRFQLTIPFHISYLFAVIMNGHPETVCRPSDGMGSIVFSIVCSSHLNS